MVNERMDVYLQKGEISTTIINVGVVLHVVVHVCRQLVYNYIHAHVLDRTKISSVVHEHCIRRRFVQGMYLLVAN